MYAVTADAPFLRTMVGLAFQRAQDLDDPGWRGPGTGCDQETRLLVEGPRRQGIELALLEQVEVIRDHDVLAGHPVDDRRALQGRRPHALTLQALLDRAQQRRLAGAARSDDGDAGFERVVLAVSEPAALLICPGEVPREYLTHVT